MEKAEDSYVGVKGSETESTKASSLLRKTLTSN